MTNRLQQEFNYVRVTFYPRWDRGCKWRVCSGTGTAYGKCEPGTKRILVNQPATSSVKFRLLLIHEIAHAVTSGGHGVVWQRRMNVAANRADKIGMPELANAIREEIQGYRDSPPVTAETVYNQIQDIHRDCPNLTFRQVVDAVREDFLISRGEFLKRYPRAKRVYFD